MASDPERTEDMGDADEQVLDITSSQLLRRPDVLAALQGVPFKGPLTPFTGLRILPPNVKRRVKALKKIQLEATHLEAKFYEEVHALEIKYHQLYLPFYEKRSTIVSGNHEPSPDECDFPSDDEKDELADELQTKVKIEDAKVKIEDAAKENESDMPDAESGIPEFWLTIFKNVGMLNEMIQPHDEPILKHLHDIKVEFLKADPMGFILEFHFTPNEYFTNTVLTKTYHMTCVPEESNPFGFEGPEIFKCFGCKIDWNKGKNVTVKIVKKRQKHKISGCSRALAKTVQNDSFFNFFNPPHVPEGQEAELDSETQELLTSDFEIGHYIRERIVPRAVLFYTGEALEEEEDDFEDDEEDEEAEEEEDGDEEDEDEVEEVGKGGMVGGRKNLKVKKPLKNVQQTSECNQQ